MSTFSILHFGIASLLLATVLLVFLPRRQGSKTGSNYLALGLIALLIVPLAVGSLSNQTGASTGSTEIDPVEISSSLSPSETRNMSSGLAPESESDFPIEKEERSLVTDSVELAPTRSPIIETRESGVSPVQPAKTSWIISVSPLFRNLLTALMIVWIAGIVWKLVRLASALIEGWLSQAGWNRITIGAAKDEFDSMVGEMGMRRKVELFEGAVSTPMCTGTFRPKVVLPEGQLAELRPGELRMIFAHELTHIRQGDLLWIWMELAVRVLHWWSPLAKRLCEAFAQGREEICDLVAVERGCPKTYGQLLLKMSSQRTLNRFPASVTMAGNCNSLKERLMNLQKRKQTKVILTPMLLIPIACLIAMSPALCHLSPAADVNEDGGKGDTVATREAEATILELAYWPTRFDTWIDRCKLKPLKEDKQTIDPSFLTEFGLEGRKAAKVQELLEKFMGDVDALGDELMFRGDPSSVKIPGGANQNPVEYLEVPRRDGPQILLKRKYALDLAAVVGDPAVALALVQLVSRDYNHHGRLAIAHPITKLEVVALKDLANAQTREGGDRAFVVRRIFLSSAGRNPIGEGDSAGSAASLEKLPGAFGRFFAAEKIAADGEAKNAAFGGPVSDSINEMEHPSMESQRAKEPVDQLDEPKLGPLITKNRALAKIIMEHTNLIRFHGKTELLTLFHIGVPEKPAREMSGILDQTVVELTKQLADKNKGAEIVINGPHMKVKGLTRAEHAAVVAELKANLTKRFPDFPAELTEYVSEAFSKSTSDYTKRWKIKVTEDRESGITFSFGGYPRQTDAESTDLEGNRTKVTMLPYPLHFLKYVDPEE